MSKKAEDVIDVSSDEEPAPPKRPKPVPNAMVHIPQQLRGVTIKPIRANPLSIQKALAGKPITLTKVSNMISNPFANKNKHNSRQMQTQHSTSIKPTAKIHKSMVDAKVTRFQQILPPKALPAPTANSSYVTTPQATIKKLPSKLLVNPIRIQSPNTLNKLPPSITVTRSLGLKRQNRPGISNVAKKRPKLLTKNIPDEVLTVELDDDEVIPASTSSPQWYMRPEELKEQEEKNNKEPEPTNLIEITIEDSPVKPPIKHAFEVGVELAITIDDSPRKSITLKNNGNGSDNENMSTSKEPHSKKKLEYPGDHKIGDTFEVEIVSMKASESTTTASTSDTTTDKTDHQQLIDDNIVLIQESPAKGLENFQTSTPKKKKVRKIQLKSNPTMEKVENPESGEFHPVYQNFIDLCLKLENSDDMQKIVDKKIKAYYKQVPKQYTDSEEFIDMISSKIMAINAGPQKMYLYIKDIVDELNLQRKLSKSNTNSKEATVAETEKFLYGENTEFDSKRKRQIRKLEKTLKKLHRAINKLEEQEVDFDDEEDSVYLLTERYKERMVRVHAKFCQLTNTKLPSEPRVQIDARPGQPKGPAKRLEKWINKKVPIGTPLPFPDFHDVLRCVKDANEDDNLGWNDADIMEEARDLFTRCGKKLQRRRQENEWRLAAFRIQSELDPAENSDELRKKLDHNLQLASKKESDVFNKFADRQNLLKLEAVEIGDKEADESPVESGDDEVSEETSSLENTEKRKERLKRLLQQKSKKNFVKDDQPDKKAELDVSPPDAEMDKMDTVKETENIKNVTDKAEGEALVTNSDATDIINQDMDQCNDNEKTQSLSDDSNAVGSDIDELHLLQKLHSGNENFTTTFESSDSDTPIAISDTLDSDSDNKNQSDVISIENSSFSEADNNDETNNHTELQTNALEATIDMNVVIECSNDGSKMTLTKSNNDEYNESIEDILLASSDDETVLENKSKTKDGEVSGTKGDGDKIIGQTEPQDNKLKECEDLDGVTVKPTEKPSPETSSEEYQMLTPTKDLESVAAKSDSTSVESILPVDENSVRCKDSEQDKIDDSNKAAPDEGLVNIPSKVAIDVIKEDRGNIEEASSKNVPLEGCEKNTTEDEIISHKTTNEASKSVCEVNHDNETSNQNQEKQANCDVVKEIASRSGLSEAIVTAMPIENVS